MLLAPFSTFKWKAQKYVCLIITVALVATFIATRTQFFPSFSSEKTVAFQHSKCREWNENQCNCNFRANTSLWRSFTWFMCKSETNSNGIHRNTEELLEISCQLFEMRTIQKCASAILSRQFCRKAIVKRVCRPQCKSVESQTNAIHKLMPTGEWNKGNVLCVVSPFSGFSGREFLLTRNAMH